MPVHLHKIKIAPGFDDLAGRDARNGHTGEVHWRLGSGNTEAVSSMSGADAAARRDEIALSNLTVMYYQTLSH